MKHVGKELNAYIESNKLVKKEIAEKIGVTPTYLSQIMQKESIDCSLLDRICGAIGMNAASIFDAEIAQENNATISLGEIEMMKELLKEKDKRIELLIQCNRLLESQIKAINPGQNSDS